MSDEIDIEGIKYVSSKRAAQSTGYAQDYIGQLARGGYIVARRVGGLWYVSLDSVQEHEKNAELIKAQQLKSELKKHAPTAEVDSLLTFDGVEYISASRASSVTGYNPDYIGQLARSSTIPARQVGSRWYVDRVALEKHKSEKDALLAAVQADAVGLVRPSAGLVGKIVDPQPSSTYYTYSPDAGNLRPSIGGKDSLVPNEVRDSNADQRDSENTHQIPIKKYSDTDKKVVEVTSRTGEKTIYYVVLFGVALTLIVIGSYYFLGIFGRYVDIGGGGDLFGAAGSFLESVFSRELLYIRI